MPEVMPSENRATMPGSRSESRRRKQVRLALVMNGGVSLAVWMGGVTRVIARVCSAWGLEPRIRSATTTQRTETA